MKYFITAIITIHGLIHLMGGFHQLGIAKFEELSFSTLIPMTEWVKVLYGVLWFLAVAIFLVAGFGLVTNRDWWKAMALGAVILSQVLVIIWWPAAKVGTIPNIIIVVALFLL